MKTAAPSVNFPELEKNILAFWKSSGIFKKSLAAREKSKQFFFYDGPPFATGTPHYGHILAGTIKDIVPRYQTMRGAYVERRFGWDTHGLPIEMNIEKDLELKGRTDILEFGIGKFNEACRAGVLKYVDEWEKATDRLGRWVDFQNDYKTMDPWFMESVWWVFSELWKQGRIYEGKRVMPYSWRLSTPLSNFEASSNYKDVQDPAITVRFKLKEKPGVSLLAWTTTPWTLPSNFAACVGPDIDYAEIKTKDGEVCILAEARLSAYFKSAKEYEVLGRLKGTELVGLTYEPLFDFFASERANGGFRVVADSYVSTEDGTGVVHQAPPFGEDDYRISKLHGIPFVDPVDAEGNFTSEVPPFAGKNIKEADKDIIKSLKDRGFLFRQETLTHSYPYCWRSDTPLIYKAISAWYVKVEDLREEMLANNSTIRWVPDHIKDGRFGKWLEQARDWNISRNRFWGNPLPVWRCESCGGTECLSSRAELEERSGQSISDLHKHFVDTLHWKCGKCAGQMTRVAEVLDCWFESGAMPYAQLHYPFENKEKFSGVFPADFIAEGLDQTRGWFYTLIVLSTALFKKAPFKNVIVNGIILAEDGRKMSKSLKNYPDPMKVMDEYGSDSLRLYLINSPAVRAETLRFSEAGVKEIVRSVLLPFWNAYSFFTTYANIDNFKPSKALTDSENILDRWIISRFQTLAGNIEREMEAYKLYAVVPALLEFIEELTNWYVRRSRRRFWSDDSVDKQAGYNTLYYILLNLSRTLAPFLPFVTDEIFRNLATLDPKLPESVHLDDYPRADESLRNPELERAMSLIQRTVGLGRALRASADLKVRQPLASITVVTRNEGDAGILKAYGDHIKEELNVKQVLFSSRERDFVEITVKPNFRLLGPIFGQQMGELGKMLSNLGGEDIEKLEAGESISVLGRELNKDGISIVRTPKENLQIETAGGVTVFYDTKLTPELRAEGLAREFVNRVQRMRKDAGFEVTDRIKISFKAPDEIAAAIRSFENYIKDETLALEIRPGDGESAVDEEIDGVSLRIGLSRIS